MKFFIARANAANSKARLNDEQMLQKHRRKHEKYRLKRNAREPEAPALGQQVEKGEGQACEPAVVLCLHAEHPPVQANGVNKGQQKIQSREVIKTEYSYGRWNPH
jgi:hypothetical protein